LDTAEGNVDPSMISALGQNPAGLTRNSEAKISGGIRGSQSTLTPFTYGLGYFTGNGSVGGALSIGGRTEDSSTVDRVELGLAAEFPSARFSLGVSGRYYLDQGSASANGNLGLILNPEGDLRVGVVAYDLAGSPDSYGAGIAFDPSTLATLLIDLRTGSKLKGLSLKPAFAIRSGGLHLTLGYGFWVDHSSESSLLRGACAGLGFALDQKLFFAATLRQLGFYRFELTLRL
jgi:hypothetical protein